MLEYLPQEIREGLEAARKRDFARKSRLRVQVGEAVFPIIRFWHDGFALDAALAPHRSKITAMSSANSSARPPCRTVRRWTTGATKTRRWGCCPERDGKRGLRFSLIS